MKITAIIPCFNEEENIRYAIESVLWADEVLVVDSFSTDGTLDIIKSFDGIHFIQHEYINSASQKNWIIPQAKHEWIILLDADEVVTPELALEIQNLKLASSPYDAFDIKRQNFFFDKKLNHIWKSDSVIRLFKRDTCAYEELDVHAEIVTDGKLSKLENPIHHHSFKSMSHYIQKMDRYAKWSAADYLSKTGRVGFFHLVVKPFARFFKHYFLQRGILDGKAGLQISAIQSWSVFMRYIYLIELKSKQKNNENSGKR